MRFVEPHGYDKLLVAKLVKLLGGRGGSDFLWQGSGPLLLLKSKFQKILDLDEEMTDDQPARSVDLGASALDARSS
jgi:hypothetical protein